MSEEEILKIIWSLKIFLVINKNRNQKFTSNNVRDLFVTRKNMCKD
jgi:hypothetical protein